ncbi:MAG: hypothetical protein QOD77_1690 [Thermoplasmata archaeon]|jgi:hypothetical protein|nr:hypothetical protein [Thermoplasmata archaeon]
MKTIKTRGAGRPIVRAALAVLLLLAVAGCMAPSSPPTPPPDPVDAGIGTPIEMDHDHTDSSLHRGAYNLEQVAWSSLGVVLGENGFANFVLHQQGNRTLAFVAVDGDAEGGFTVADITDPAGIQVLGDYRAPGSGFQEVRVSPDGRWAFQNVQEIPGAAVPADPVAACSACIHVVDLADLAAPKLSSVFPVELLGTHNMDLVAYPDGLYLFYVGQPLDSDNTPGGNKVGVARLVESPVGAALVPVGEFRHPALLDDGRSFPHDVLVQQHPDGRRIGYVSHWDGGVVTFDASTPSALVPLGVNKEQQPSDALAIHWTIQEERARRDGRTIAWSAPEIGSLATGTGAVRSYDASDPAALRQLGTWTLPGNLSIEGQFLLSPHTVAPDMATGLVAVAHYHAGVWILDGTDPAAPKALGYAFPNGDATAGYPGPIWWKKPNFDPDGFLPNAYQARWHDGLLWVTERGTGLYAYRYTGPVPGPL